MPTARVACIISLIGVLVGCVPAVPALTPVAVPTTPACADLATALPSETTMTYLALGDSYTIGESVDPTERWPVQLAALLAAQGFNVGAPSIIARTGWTTDELSAAIDQADPQGPFELVTLLIGVNNQYRGRSVGEYREQFTALLKRAIGFAGGQPERVLVLSIPDWGVTPYAQGRDRTRIAEQIDEFNAAAAVESERLGVVYIDVTPISRKAAAQPELIAGDGLHPSGAMYAEWAALTLPAACAALGSKGP